MSWRKSLHLKYSTNIQNYFVNLESKPLNSYTIYSVFAKDVAVLAVR